MTIKTTQLHGGTLGDVKLLEGTGMTAGGKPLPDKVVHKTQKQWERYDDPGSWRREYDLYASGLGGYFTDTLRWPECYHAEDHGGRIELWLEYINGTTGLDLTGDMIEQAAYELGRWQGKIYAERPAAMAKLDNLSRVSYAERFYRHYRSWKVVFDYIRSEDCAIPKHLCDMLIQVDKTADEIFRRIEKLPIVFCHRDFWITNIFHTDQGIRLIDWDTSGWGYLGEDIAQLICDEADVDHMVEYYKRCVPAYYRGFSEYVDVSHVTDDCIWELMVTMYGYRIVEWYLDAETSQGKALQINTLQRICEMRNHE